jgi:hypothetical protein
MSPRLTSLTVTVLILSLFILPSQAINFTDNNYHEYLLYDMDTPEIDVLIVPPSSPYYARDIMNLEKSVQAWDDGINDLAPSWLADGLNIHYFTLGYDEVPAPALADPEVIIYAAEFNPVLLLGIGLEPWQNVFVGETPCTNLDPLDQAQWHGHENSPWASAQCQGMGGSTCVVINTNFLWLPDQENEIQMYDLNQHEFGHCIGIGHVGDALDFAAANYPEQDIMSYQRDVTQVHCVSSLNIRALEATYGDLLGQSSVAQDSGTYVHMNQNDYTYSDCKNPGQNWLDLGPINPLTHNHPTPGSTLNS